MPELDTEYVGYNQVGGVKVDYEWSIGDSADRSAPTWTDPPEVAEARHTFWSDGSDVEIDISFPVVDDGPTLAVAEVAPFGPGPAKSYMIPIREGKISLGHNICSAHFSLWPGTRHQIWLTAMDAAGNLSTTRSSPIAFTAPEE